ncbi:MAG TPA: hypothetical protein VJ577_12675, partial [Burkholderiaceae bacterium]|nr:hypothetical protein [Burkholderiaceae bacterium]
QLLLPLCSDDVIEALVMVACGENGSSQTKHFYRESLRNLVRLAKVEYAREADMELRYLPIIYSEGRLH